MSEATALHVWDRGIGWEVHREHGGGCDERGAINDGWSGTFTEEGANRIVRRFNAHDPLVEALEAIAHLADSRPFPNQIGEVARAALKEAKR